MIEQTSVRQKLQAASKYISLLIHTHDEGYRRVLKWTKDLLLFLFLCGIVYGLNPDLFDGDMSSGETLSILPFICIYCSSYVAGEIGSYINLPRILSQIIGGILVGNIWHMQFNALIASMMRNIAFCTILIEGGIGLNPQVLKSTPRICLQLCFIPLAVDTVASAILAHTLLHLPLIWSFMLGFVLSAACAAIIVPNMMYLQSKSIGTAQGIPSMVIAAASMDDVVAIAGFGILNGYAFAGYDGSSLGDKSSTFWTIVKGPLEIAGGIGLGFVIGSLIGAFPLAAIWSSHGDPSISTLKIKLTRASLLLSASLASIFISEAIHMASLGPLSVLTGAFFAALKFRQTDGITKELSDLMHVIWTLTMPFLFGIMGAEFRLRDLEPSHIVPAVILVVLGAAIRLVTTYLSLWGSPLNVKEKCYVAVAWLAKAAVQATLAPIVYDQAVKRDLVVVEEYGVIIRTVAVLAVLISCPIAIFGSRFLPQYWLQTQVPEQTQVRVEGILTASRPSPEPPKRREPDNQQIK